MKPTSCLDDNLFQFLMTLIYTMLFGFTFVWLAVTKPKTKESRTYNLIADNYNTIVRFELRKK